MFSEINTDLFLTEPLLFQVSCTHTMRANSSMTVPFRSGKMVIEYNPKLLKDQPKSEVTRLYKRELIRILLKHPYQRKPEPFLGPLAYFASNLTIEQNPKDLKMTQLPGDQHFEYYYFHLLDNTEISVSSASVAQLSNQDDEKKSGGSDSSGGSGDESKSGQSDGSGKSIEDGKSGDSGTSGGSDGEKDKNKSEDSGSSGTSGSSGDESKSSQSDEAGKSMETGTDGKKDNEKTISQDEQNALSGAGLWDEDTLMTETINNLITQWQSSGKDWGTVPKNIQEQIIASLKARIDYRQVLKSFRASIISDKRMLTRYKPSRRYGFEYMGSKFDFTTRLLIAIDTSDSVSDLELENFFGVINKIFKYGIKEIEVLYFDCAIKDKPETFRKAQKSYTVTGRGGTSFQTVFDYCAQHPVYDGCIIFTDGYAPEPEKAAGLRTRFAWVCTTEEEYNKHNEWMMHTGKACFLTC